MSFKWYHFSFKKKKIKQGTMPNNILSTYTYPGTVWKSSISPIKRESLGKCEICGNDIFDVIHECELCGKKTCEDCMMVLTQLIQTLHLGGSTVWNMAPYFVPTRVPSKAKPHDIKICTSCADLLKLALRIASTQDYDIKQEEKE